VQKLQFLFVIIFSILLTSCLGVGSKAIFVEQSVSLLPYDKAFDLSLRAAEEMVETCKKRNPINFPIIVSLGTSKSRGVITLHYKFDPEAGSVCTPHPKGLTPFAKEWFVPHFGAEFYMHIRFQKEGDMVKGLNIEVTQMKGIKKKVFDEEREKLKDVYIEFLKKYWK